MPARYGTKLTKSFLTGRGKPKSARMAPQTPASARRSRKWAEGAAMKHPVVLITGALTGIGRAAAVAFARGGNRIVISGRHEEAGQALVAELRELGAEAEFVRADVRH